MLSSPKAALVGLDNVMIIVSSASARSSSMIFGIVMMLVFSPGPIIRVPGSKSKSMPEPVAVPVSK